ncbi:MAG: hypothetical protein KA714_04965 [Limnoraphis sp. WC205]|nr:hypothetical protein [Limnoraphis sp. WC205]
MHQVPEKPIFWVLNYTVGHTEIDLCNGVNAWGDTTSGLNVASAFGLSRVSEPEIHAQ